MRFKETINYGMLIALLVTTIVFAQKQQIGAIDSLLAGGMIRSNVQSFYIKPIVEQYQSLVSVEGAGFSSPNGDLLRKRGLGIRLGYRWKRYELETGLSTIRPAAGYRYLLNHPGFGHITRVRSTDFQQIPLVFRYRFWQPIKRLSLKIGIGFAYNIDLNRASLAATDNSQIGTNDANGNAIVLERVKSRYDKEKSFFSGEINASAHYQFSTHFSASLEFKRLFSETGVVRLSATQETFNPSVFRNVDARGGANGYGINFGVTYRFGFRNRYQLN